MLKAGIPYKLIPLGLGEYIVAKGVIVLRDIIIGGSYCLLYTP